MSGAELALVESPTLRSQHINQLDVLDKVKVLTMLPGDMYVTTEMAAAYFEVDAEAIKKVAQRAAEELRSDGYRVVEGDELRDMKSLSGLGGRARSLALLPRRAVLRLGMLLRDSPVARQVREYLLNLEQAAPIELRMAAVGPVPYREQAEILAILRPTLPEHFVSAKGKIILARSMGEMPELDPAEVPLYATAYLAERGLKRRTIANFEAGFGLRVSNRYLKARGRRPEKIDGPVGSKIAKVNVFEQADRPILDEVYGEMADLFAAFETGVTV